MVHDIMHKDNGLDLETKYERAGWTAQATGSSSDPFNVKIKSGRLEVRRRVFSVRLEQDTGSHQRPPSKRETGVSPPRRASEGCPQI
jgi:hypothetical protein